MREGFEGLYFRHLAEGRLLALIPGRSAQGAFLQVLTESAAYQVPFGLEAYQKTGKAALCVGSNRFSHKGISLNLRTRDLRLTGSLTYGPWTPLRYDIMGPFRCVPMECRHQVLSMLHTVSGQVVLNGTLLPFDGGLGYVEGDRGRSFPSQYGWFQAFDGPKRASIMISAAQIPFLGSSFWGCIAVVWLDGREYRLATYLGARVEALTEQRIGLAQGGWRLEAEVLSPRAHPLQAPINGQMTRVIHESGAVPARVRFSKGDLVLFEGEFPFAGHEFAVFGGR